MNIQDETPIEEINAMLPAMPYPPEDTLGYEIRYCRHAMMLSQRELAALAGVDFTYISKIENNRLENAPSVKTLIKIADALNVIPDTLIELAQKSQIQVLQARIAELEAENAALRKQQHDAPAPLTDEYGTIDGATL